MTRLIEAEAIVANGLSEAGVRAAMLDEYPIQALGVVTALQANTGVRGVLSNPHNEPDLGGSQSPHARHPRCG